MVNKTTEYSTFSSESVVVVVLASSGESLLVENTSVPYTLDNFSTSPNLSHFTPDCYKQMMHKIKGDINIGIIVLRIGIS